MESNSWESMLWTPYLFSNCGHHLLRVNALDYISRLKIQWTPSLGNQCYGLHILSVSVDSMSDEQMLCFHLSYVTSVDSICCE